MTRLEGGHMAAFIRQLRKKRSVTSQN